MRKKFLSVLLSAAMVTTLMAGCSNNAGNDTTTQAPSQGTTVETTKGDTTTETTKGTDTAEQVTLKWAIWDKESTAYWQALADEY